MKQYWDSADHGTWDNSKKMKERERVRRQKKHSILAALEALKTTEKGKRDRERENEEDRTSKSFGIHQNASLEEPVKI